MSPSLRGSWPFRSSCPPTAPFYWTQDLAVQRKPVRPIGGPALREAAGPAWHAKCSRALVLAAWPDLGADGNRGVPTAASIASADEVWALRCGRMDRPDPFGWLGSVIEGQFAVEAIAGEGAFGIVYRGTHLGFEAPVAIKCLKMPADLQPEQRQAFLATFRAEARLLHRLSRRTTGIVQALDVGVATSPTGAWTPYTVM